MIWDEPWIAVATQYTGSQYSTTLPPPLPPPSDFICMRWTDISAAEWIELVRTGWTAEELSIRLQDAWIPLLRVDGRLVGTCVLWQNEDTWILETLRAQRGHGSALMRSIMRWIWDRVGIFKLSFTWELTGTELMAAWWRGWLRAAVAIEYGWVFAASGCGWCPTTDWVPSKKRFCRPVRIDTDGGWAIVNDAGMADGWGHVVAWNGEPNWSIVAEKGGWKRLWYHSQRAPNAAWRWTGEFVVIGSINDGYRLPTHWITAEIA